MRELSLGQEEFTFACDGERLSVVRVGAAPGRATVVLLHGAGAGSKARLLPAAAEFAARGCHALACDFSGHGDSTGALAELSLRRRYEQAVAVIDAHAPADAPLILVGFSMSGQTVADLVRHYGPRVAALALGAPAVYAPAAWDVPFGTGDGRFTEILRTPDSWRDSPALAALRAYEGRSVLVVPGTDAVIPGAVTEAVQDALAARSQYTRLELPDADHSLGLWFRDHPEDCGELAELLLGGLEERGWSATRRWVGERLPKGRVVVDSRTLQGGWSSQMRVLGLDDGTELVQRSFVKPFFRRVAPALLSREAAVLELLAGEPGIPAPGLVAVDASGQHCDHPSLLMTKLPGRLRVDAPDPAVLDLLAAQLVRIHAVAPEHRPRVYEAWTWPERVRAAVSGGVWDRAVELIDREPPSYRGRFLHRDYHPGNVLFTGEGQDPHVSGVVDWVETSWGPADLDVAHCSTALALLHGPEHGLAFRARYERQGGHGLLTGPDHLYWRLLDALAYVPDASKLAEPWRELGRTDLTPEVLSARLEAYVGALLG
ncbi:alpha/beta fold hydrolase [Streptomyces sp. NPDC005435]|uniref:alpha/beta fold hydrolase n=1 Tax=Streptomyces sp. NPDC005435 TaxID=3154464 RepID=UPI00345422A6